MKKSKFMLYNILSSLLWSFTLVFAGHYLYNLFLDQFNVDLKKHIETIILTLIAITTFPLVWNYFKQKKLLKNQE